MQAMGAAVGDYDDDGWVDLLVTGVGGNRLYRNHEGKYADVTDAAGVHGADEDWTTCATWFDYDNDGKLICMSAIMCCGVDNATCRSRIH